ncbi:globin-like protein [Truncatella angustata]|uniref:nitric oxide dioxygenase n=1 Tax=Truncatella angustata TaxID=152316 RepID=A0A9P8UZL5_9PEZI|nr:globin-like protein [Truncatella angustata]KAH6661330.1 globin-like protein [Truncatella angustata]
MALTYNQMKLVKGTIPTLREHGEHISTVFYKTMLKDHPELNNYFNAVNMKSGRQPRALTQLILAYASNISHISELTPKFERVANKHVSLGIQPDHYEIVCKYLMRAFAAVLGPAMDTDVRVAWTKAYWIMANMLAGRERQLYREHENWKGFRRFIVDKKTRETTEGDIVSFELKAVDGVPLPAFMPGQYVSLRVRVPGSGYLQIRQYSLSDTPRPDRYRISVKRSTTGDSFLGIMDYSKRKQGVVSNLLIDEIMEGDVLELSHPSGDFYLDTSNDSGSTPLVFISAGIGVSPILSMLNTVTEKNSTRPITWAQGSKQSIPFEEHVMKLAKTRPNMRTTFFNTGMGNKDLAESTDSLGFGYYLEWLKEEDMYFSNRSTEYYICGPERFMKDISTYLVTNGVSSAQIRYELHSVGSFELAQDA